MKFYLSYCIVITILLSSCTLGERNTANGTIHAVYSHGTDLVIELQDDEGKYYLNRYLEHADEDSLKALLLHKKVYVRYYSSHNILNLRGLSRPIDTLWADTVKLY